MALLEVVSLFPLRHRTPFAKAVGEALTSKAAEHCLAPRPLCQLEIRRAGRFDPPLPGFHFTPTRHQFGRSAVTRRNTSAACRVDEVCKKQFTTAICQATQFAASSSKLSHAPVKYRTMRGSPSRRWTTRTLRLCHSSKVPEFGKYLKLTPLPLNSL